MSAAREWETARALADQLDQWGHTAAEALRIPTLIATAAAKLRQDDWDIPAQLDDPLRDLTVAILALAGWDESGLTDEIKVTERHPDEILRGAQAVLARQVTNLILRDGQVNPSHLIDTLGQVMRGIATARAAAETEVDDLRRQIDDLADEAEGLNAELATRHQEAATSEEAEGCMCVHLDHDFVDCPYPAGCTGCLCPEHDQEVQS